MKRYFYAILIAALVLGCDSKFSDEFESLRNDVESLNARLDELCGQTNDNLDALQALVDAIESNDYITSIEPVYENGEEIGYKINFFKGDVIVIYNGKDGVDGAPGEDGTDGEDGSDGSHGTDGMSLQIGVRQGNDGKWYWTVTVGDTTSWMRDENGNRVPASPTDGKDGEDGNDGEDGEDGKDGEDGEDGVTPRLKIVDGFWYLSLDGGVTWKEYGKATGNPGEDGKDGIVPVIVFSEVYYDDSNAYFVLKSGYVLTIPLRKPFSITLEQTVDVPVQAGCNVSVGYTITGVDDETIVECICEGGWKAEIEKENFFSGKVNIRAPYPFSEGKVAVMATKPDGSLVMQSITFVEIESEPVLLSYCDDPEELDGWEEALCTGDGTLVTGRPQVDGGYLLAMTELNGDQFALVSISPEGNIRQIFSNDGIIVVSQDRSKLILYDGNTFSVIPIEPTAATMALTKALDPTQTAGGMGLLGNMASMYDSLGELSKGSKLSVAGFLLSKTDAINNFIKLLTGYDLLASNPYLTNALKISGGLVDIASILITGVSGWGIVALVANIIATYIEAYDEAITSMYGNCTAQISNIEVEGVNATITVNVSGWESLYNTLEVGIAIGDFFHPSINENSHVQSISRNGDYSFSETGLEVGTTYHCRPFVAEKNRESMWNNDFFNYIGWDDDVNQITGPLIRYGKDESFSIPKPAARTGDVIEKEDKSAIVGCSFANVPPGASCGIEVDETLTFTAGKDAEQVTLSGLTPATAYSYRAYVKYQGETYYGSSKSFTTDLPDVTGTWTCKEIHEKSDGTTSYSTYSVTLHKDGTVTLSKDETYTHSSWSRTAKGMSVTWSINVGDASNWSSSATSLSITFDDPSNPTSGKGTASRVNANSVVGGFAPQVYAAIEMYR